MNTEPTKKTRRKFKECNRHGKHELYKRRLYKIPLEDIKKMNIKQIADRIKMTRTLMYKTREYLDYIHKRKNK